MFEIGKLPERWRKQRTGIEGREVEGGKIETAARGRHWVSTGLKSAAKWA